MASILKVDTIQDQAGNNIISENANVITIGASGDTITVPAGATVSGFTSAGIDDNATSTAITINSSENVGIGTSSPGAKLEIQTGSDWGNIINSTYTGTQYLQQFEYNGTPIGKIRGDNSSISIESGSNLILQTTNTERMRINSSGNVGIGTSSPSGTLDVQDNTGSLSATQDITAEFARIDGTKNPRLQIRHSTTGSDIHHTYGSGADKLTITLAGTERMRFANSEVVFNEDGNDKDFRVESSTDSGAFYMNGADGRVSLGSFGSTGKFNVNADGFSTSANNAHIMLRNGNNTGGVGTGDKTLIMSEVTSGGGAPYRPVAFGAENTQQTLREGAFVVYVSDTQSVDLSTDERLRITKDGRVGIGTNNPSYPLQINSSAQTTLLHLVSTAGTFSAITFANTGSNDSISIGAENDDIKLRTDDGVIKFFTNENSEKMRIDTSGSLLVGTTSLPRINSATAGFDADTTGGTNSTTLADQEATVTIDGYIGGSNTNGDTNVLCLTGNSGAASRPGNLIRGYGGNNAANLNFEVQHDGDVLNANNSYGSISDERVKQNIIDAPSSWNDIKNIRVRKYKLNSDIERYSNNPVLGEAPYHIGVISQEIETVSPGLIKQDKLEDGTPDENSMKHVKYSVLYMKAVKALQEAMERIETLEAKVQTLETNQP